MERWYYQYCIAYYDDCHGSEHISEGLICADSFHEAFDRLCDWYGEQDINEVIYLAPVTEWLDKETLDNMSWKSQDYTDLNCCGIQVFAQRKN